jgi:hypothetical protein
MLIVIYAECHMEVLFAECRYAECCGLHLKLVHPWVTFTTSVLSYLKNRPNKLEHFIILDWNDLPLANTLTFWARLCKKVPPPPKKLLTNFFTIFLEVRMI